MRILRVISTMDPRFGGPVEGIRQISRALDAQGHATEIVTADDPGARWVAESPWPHHALGPPSGSTFWYSPRLTPWLRRHAPEFDCVIVHGVWRYPSFGAWRALRGTETPYFVYPHGMLDPWFRSAYPLKHLKKALYWRLAEHRVLRDARAVLFTCEEEKILAGRSFRPYRCEGVAVSYGTSGPSGDADAQRRSFLERFPEAAGKRNLLYLSRIHPKKGCDLLIEAFADVAAADPDLRLVMAGPDEVAWQPELTRLAESRGVADRLTWAGMLSGDLKWGAFRAAEAFVLPSHQENFGISVVEALACGLPVLISDKVNIWREIQADGAGIIAGDDRASFATALRGWLALGPAEREAMSRRALDSFNRRFHIRAAAEGLIRTLGDLGVKEGTGAPA